MESRENGGQARAKPKLESQHVDGKSRLAACPPVPQVGGVMEAEREKAATHVGLTRSMCGINAMWW